MEEFEKYYDEIGMSEVAIERARKMIRIILDAAPATPKYVFVTDRVDKEGARQFGSLWLGTDKYITEAKSFMTQIDYDFISSGYKFKYMEINYTDFEGREATEKSRVTLSARSGTMGLDMSATGNNCVHLVELIRREFTPEKRLRP